MRNSIIDAFNAVLEKYKKEEQTILSGLKNEKAQLNPDSLSVTQYNARVEAFNQKAIQQKKWAEKFEDFCKEFNKMDEGNNIVGYLVNQGIIVNGKVDTNNYLFKQLNPYNIEVLNRLQSFQTGEDRFK